MVVLFFCHISSWLHDVVNGGVGMAAVEVVVKGSGWRPIKQ
jgi:hypothetical protein